MLKIAFNHLLKYISRDQFDNSLYVLHQTNRNPATSCTNTSLERNEWILHYTAMHKNHIGCHKICHIVNEKPQCAMRGLHLWWGSPPVNGGYMYISYRIAPYRTATHSTTPHSTTPHHTTLHRTASHRIVSHHIISDPYIIHTYV